MSFSPAKKLAPLFAGGIYSTQTHLAPKLTWWAIGLRIASERQGPAQGTGAVNKGRTHRNRVFKVDSL